MGRGLSLRHVASMEPQVLRVSEADAASDLAAKLKRVQAAIEVVIERDAQPLAMIRPAVPPFSVVSVVELTHGIERASTQERRLRRQPRPPCNSVSVS